MRPWWGIVMMLLLAACTSHKNGDAVETRRATSLPTDVSPELSAIDSLMWQRPDSALTCLLPYFDTCCRDGVHTVSTPHDCHYANLLLAELLYKNDNPQLNRAELLQAVDYYDSLCCRDAARHVSTDPILMFLDARAHYINGVGFYERDSVVEACQEYLKALEVMEERFDEKELAGNKAMFTALTYTRISLLFSDMYLHEQAIYFAQQYFSVNQELDVPRWHIARMLCEIGIQYEIMKQTDSAEYYYKNALVALNDTNTLLYRDISARQTVLSYKKNGLLDCTLTRLHHLIQNADNETESLLRYLTIGEVFYHEKQYDSAWYYIYYAYNKTRSMGSKKQAAEWLLDISKIQQRDDEIVEYAAFLAQFANREENQSEVKSQLTECYNSYRQGLLARQHQQKIKKITTMGVVVISILIFGLLVYFVLYHTSRRRKQHLEKQIEEEKHSHEMKQRALSGRLKQSNQELHNTRKRMEGQEKEQRTEKTNSSYDTFGEKYKAFIQTPICQEIIDMVNRLHADNRILLKTNADITEYKAFALSKSQAAQLSKTVVTVFPNLYDSLRAKYASLDNKKWLLCCLYLLSLDKMSICVLLQEPYYTCRRHTIKLEKNFDCRQGLPEFLIEQATIC